ncbi:uncharacterized protein KIAA0513-like isoform X2 [Antedon mediterranea]|uniref:uncharacterized protein KIAA0513-like isoform X2 n=1 Tax=Antedon mediterranea TaxID=105859 RepID=UPI003AF6ED4F
MMSSMHDPIVRRGSDNSHIDNDEYTSAGTSTSSLDHGESTQKEGYINGVIRKLTSTSESSATNGTSSCEDTDSEPSSDVDNMTSGVSVAALRGHFESVTSLLSNITKGKTSKDLHNICDANSNSINVKSNDSKTTNANEINEQSTTMKPDEIEKIIVHIEEKEKLNSKPINGIIELNTENSAETMENIADDATQGRMSEDTTGGETTEYTTEASSDDELDDYDLECKVFMKDLVRRIFHDSGSITQVDNQQFDLYCRTAEGRKWFSRLVDGKRIYNKCVPEQTFYRLVQFFAVCLFECKESDDFSPAKHLMNMCFTFYHEQEGIPCNDDTTHQSYLYTHLNNQKIWRDQRFWTAAFMDSVHSEKKKRMPTGRENWGKQTQEERENTELLHENITFGQLAAFVHNMMHLGLPRSMCEEFVDKQSVIGSLNDFQINMIIGNINEHYKVEKVIEEKPVTSLQKSINKIKRKIPGVS